MALAQISEVPQTPADLQRWSFAHNANHLDIIRRIYETTQPVPPSTTPPINLQPYPLDPIIPENMANWLYWHSTMHAQMDLVLGIAGYDLLGLDWTDPDGVAEWISQNSDEHVQASKLLGIA